MFEDTLFNLRTEPVYRAVGDLNYMTGQRQMELVKGSKFVINESTNQVLSVMSEQYVPIRDYDVLQKFLELFAEANIEVTPVKHHITRSKDNVLGRTTFMEVELPQYSLFPDTDEFQKMRIVIPNSNNGTTKLKMMLMYLRQICTNGMMAWKSEFEFGFKHRSGALERLGDALNLYLVGNVQQAGNIVNLLGNVSGQQDSIMAYLQNNKILSGERWEEKLLGHWLVDNQPTNLWSLYNIFTNEITHNYGRNFGTKLAKLELLNAEVKHTWGKVLGTPDNFQEAILVA